MDEPLKIGIVLNYAKAEKKKDELLCINSKKMPWLSLANEPRYNKLVIRARNKKCVPADVAIGVFLENMNDNGEVKIIIDYIHNQENPDFSISYVTRRFIGTKVK